MGKLEDTKVLEFINKHHEESYANHVKTQKKKERRNTIECIMLILAILTAVLVLGNTIKQENTKALKNCLKSGHSENYCIRSL